MADLTIRADIVAAGVGLPDVWLCEDCGRYHCEEERLRFCPSDRDNELWAGVDASDPQTAFGLAVRLDEWERAADEDQVWIASWHRACSIGLYKGGGETVAMLARIEHIGLDHAIRRALGWEVEAGSLWALGNDHGRWHYCGTEDGVGFDADGTCVHPSTRWRRHIPSLAGITDPLEALRAIHAEVAGG